MKKCFVVLSILIVFLLVSVNVWAGISGNGVYRAIVQIPRFLEAVFMKPTESTAVGNVSGIEKLLKIETQIDFGMYKTVEKAELLYYFDGEDSTNPHSSVYDGEIQNKKSFYLSADKDKFPASSSKINYQIKITFKKETDSLGEAYWPTQLTTSSDTFHSATISSSASAEITGSEGGTITYDDGNQENTNTSVTFQPGAVEGNGDIILEEVSLDDLFSGLFPVSSLVRSAALKAAALISSSELDRSKMVKAYRIRTTDPDNVRIVTEGYAEFSYASSDTLATKFNVLYSENGANWEYIPVIKIDTSNKLVCCSVTRFGYYLIMVSSNLDDNDYRPEKRVRVKSRIANGTYEGFKFGNLEEGDVVKIFNLNGKKIAELTAGGSNGFVWKGKKDTNNSGDWAESGTYVYQIKLKEKGKIISGTIAFVW